jgi:hypothetical protein
MCVYVRVFKAGTARADHGDRSNKGVVGGGGGAGRAKTKTTAEMAEDEDKWDSSGVAAEKPSEVSKETKHRSTRRINPWMHWNWSVVCFSSSLTACMACRRLPMKSVVIRPPRRWNQSVRAGSSASTYQTTTAIAVIHS